MFNPYKEYRDCDVLWVEHINSERSHDVLEAVCFICGEDVRADDRPYTISRIKGDSRYGYAATHEGCLEHIPDER